MPNHHRPQSGYFDHIDGHPPRDFYTREAPADGPQTAEQEREVEEPQQAG
jgi:hypothetical protein